MAESLHLLTSTNLSNHREASTNIKLTSAKAIREQGGPPLKQADLGLPHRKSGSPKSCRVVGSG
ncbi:uncharacterized protein N7487_006997 [Penicillium crustosum]|uniref:uncharacterized protein n=1 Tax=Penicillium crustosum TaxID=36656 RepID=UPI00239862AD|nr:uncharacterized protein N7487_006997 [Penicillium crustosum]KAJ5412638.1 hypothetical protein N7487_006997 [Penicillium crustosum]